MNDKQVLALFKVIGNKSLFEHWKQLDVEKKQYLFSQLKKIDVSLLHLQQQLIQETQVKNYPIVPFTHFSGVGNPADKKLGLKAISEGSVGCLIVAGGQGSRLCVEGPKGICSVTKVCKKSLFQLFAEKTVAASKQAGRLLPLAIMTSPINHEDTIAYFEKHHFFGLEIEQVGFFSQKTLPILDQNGNIFLESEDILAISPNGNGEALQEFFRLGFWDKWHSQGVRYLNFVLVDNPLADPFDAELIGYHIRQRSDIVIKCTERRSPEESVGVFGLKQGKPHVVEYSELSNDERYACNADGTLRHVLANLSLFSFDMGFIKEIREVQLPLHKAFKAVKYLSTTEHAIHSEKSLAWKFETFIFDVLPFASKVDALVYPRERCFSPLKNRSGEHSLDTVCQALEKRDQEILSEITGHDCQMSPLEIAQGFYYPTPKILATWKNKKIDQPGYLEC